MKKKLSILLITLLIIGAFIPVLSVALAKKPDNTPPPLEKIVIIHYKRGHAKPSWAGGGNKESPNYKTYGKGIKWKGLQVNIVIDPDNLDGLSQSFIVDAITASAEEWDGNTESDIYRTYTIDNSSTWDDDAPDGRNELLFGDYSESGVIAVTVIWGYFSGPPRWREIIEFDILFDTDYTWGDASTGATVMDLQNIATHELGHGFGLADLYESSASEETMYGYSTEGEIKKRTLNSGDIAGIQDLYG